MGMPVSCHVSCCSKLKASEIAKETGQLSRMVVGLYKVNTISELVDLIKELGHILTAANPLGNQNHITTPSLSLYIYICSRSLCYMCLMPVCSFCVHFCVYLCCVCVQSCALGM